jgi:3-phosphoshikimate 1-carboxyvinyltransferase
LKTIVPTHRRLSGNVLLPTSKSAFARAFILGLQQSGSFILRNVPESEDGKVLIRFLETCLVDYSISDYVLTYTSEGLFDNSENYTIDCQQSGTALRFLIAFSCLLKGEFRFTGNSRLLSRPVSSLIECLSEQGINFSKTENGGFCKTGNLINKEVHFTIKNPESSQFISALMLLAPSLSEGSSIKVIGAIPSYGYAQLTQNMCTNFGCEWTQTDFDLFTLKKKPFELNEYEIQADWSSAIYFLLWLLLSGGELLFEGLFFNSGQPDEDLAKWFIELGMVLVQEDKGIRAVVSSPTLPDAFDLDLTMQPDSIMAFSALAVLTGKMCRIKGTGTLNLKESNRLDEILRIINGIGGKAYTQDNELVIEATQVNGNIPIYINCKEDHRIPMSFSILAFGMAQVIFDYPEVTAKSFPGFWEEIAKTGAILYKLD